MGETKCVLSDEFIVSGCEPGNSYGGREACSGECRGRKSGVRRRLGTGFNARTGPEVKRRLDAIPMDKPPIPSLKANGAAWAECPAQSVPQSIVEFEGGVIGVETAPAMAISTPSALFSISSRNERVNTFHLPNGVCCSPAGIRWQTFQRGGDLALRCWGQR